MDAAGNSINSHRKLSPVRHRVRFGFCLFREDEMKNAQKFFTRVAGIAIILFGSLIVLYALTFGLSLWVGQNTSELQSSTPVTKIATQNPATPYPISADTQAVSCSDAVHYLQADRIELSKQAYTAILTNDPTSKCALEGLAAAAAAEKSQAAAPTPTPLPTLTAYEAIPGLLHIGDYDGAYAKLKDSAAVHFSPTRADLNWVKLWAGWNEISAFMQEFVLPVISAFLILLILVLLFIKIRAVYFSQKIDIQKFTSGSAFFLDDNICSSITNAIQENLVKDFRGIENDSNGIIDQTINLPEMPSNISSNISGIWNVIVKLFPAKVLNITGSLEYQSSKGAGISLKLFRNQDQNIIRQTTIWEIDFTEKILPPEQIPNSTDESKKETSPQKLEYTNRAFRLARIAAAWIFWNICDLNYSKEEIRSFLGTDSYLSYFYYSLYQIYLPAKGNTHNAKYLECLLESESFLKKSLRADQHNSFAALNLANKFIKPGINQGKSTVEEYEETISLSITQNFQEIPCILANYSLGSLKFNDLLKNESAKNILHIKPKKLTDCVDSYFSPAYQGARYQEKLKNSREAKNTSSLSWNSIYAIQIPYLLRFILDKDFDTAFAELSRIEKIKSDKLNVLYNLACFYSLISYCGGFKRQYFSSLKTQFYPQNENSGGRKVNSLLDLSLINLQLSFEKDLIKTMDYLMEDETIELLKQAAEYQKIFLKFKNLRKILSAQEQEPQ